MKLTCLPRIALALILLSAGPALAVENQYEKETPVKGLLFGAPDTFVEFHGYLGFEAFNFQKDSDRPVPSFDLHHWVLSAKAEPAKSFFIFGEVEYEHGGNDIILERTFLEWDATDWIKLRLGRFHSPLSYERAHYYDPYSLLTSRPRMIDVGLHEWSDTGMEIYGNPIPQQKWLQYDFAVVNGPKGLSKEGLSQGIGKDNRDNNRNKTVIGRLNAYPVPGLTVGSAYATGKYDDSGRLGFKIVEFDSRYTVSDFDFQAEYMKRTGNDEPAPIAGNSFITGTQAGLQGYYFLAAYTLVRDRPYIRHLKPLARYDTIKNTSNGSGFNTYTIGVNYSPKKHVVFKSEYQFIREFKQPTLKNDGVMLSAVLDF